jgi:ABC-type transporter Mla subunit MlaD
VRRLIAIATVVGAVGLAFVLTGQARPDTVGQTYYIVFDNAFGLTEGGDLRVGGVAAGQTTRFSVTDEFPARAVVEAQVQDPGFVALNKDATCAVRQQSLIGEYFVDCQPGSPKAGRIPNAGTIPVEQTQSTIPIDLVQNIMRRPYRERFRLILSELGTGLAGRPEDLREVLQKAHPGFRETSKTLRVLGDQNRVIQDFIVDSDTVVRELEARKTEVSRWIAETGRTAQISADRKREIEANFRELPPFFEELEDYMVRLGEFSDAQVPTLVDLRRAAPELETTFRELGPFAAASRPAIRSLGELGDTGRQAIGESREEIDQVRILARDVPRLATPLRQFLQTADDRARSSEDDPEAEETAPPAPDKTAYKDGQGFTGFESFLNYFYFQALTLNGFDDVSHFLRIQFFIDPDCSNYETDPSQRKIDQCSQQLGPYTPGVGGDPDPTETGDVPGDREDDGGTGSGADDNDCENVTESRGADDRCSTRTRQNLRTRPGRGDPERSGSRARRPGTVSPSARRLAAPRDPRAPRKPAAPAQLLDYLMAP